MAVDSFKRSSKIRSYPEFEVDIIYFYVQNKRDLKDKLFIFATNTRIRPERIMELFRRRWGIETRYSIVRKILAKTTSKIGGEMVPSL